MSLRSNTGQGRLTSQTINRGTLFLSSRAAKGNWAPLKMSGIIFVIENDIPKAISKEEIIVSKGNERELQKLIKCVEEKSIDHKDVDMRKYSNVFNELTVVDGLVLRGERIVVPQTLREAVVKIAHEGHQGIVRTKQLLRAHVWFPGMDTMVEKHAGKCLACQSTTSCHTREPLKVTDLPWGP